MIRSPFGLFSGRNLEVALLTKEDHVSSDADIAKVLGIETDHLASIWQVHGGDAIRIERATSRALQADALFTSSPGLTLTLRTADCQGFCVYDSRHHVVGLIHAGWKGVLARVIPHAIELMKREWMTDPRDILVGAGPALCKKCSDFTDPVKELPGVSRDLIDGRYADLREAAMRQFEACGVPRGDMERLEDCTRCHPEKYWTYRGGDREAVMEGNTNVLCCTLK